MSPDRPNLVFLIADQLRANALGCAGNPLAATPTIDGLADAGTRFTEAYVQHPVCSPSRASFLTGWYPHVRGHRTLTHLLRADEPNLLRILKDAGYHVIWAGARGDTFAPGVTELSVHEYGFSEPPDIAALLASFTALRPDIEGRLFYAGCQPSGTVDVDEAATRTAERRLEAPIPEPFVLFVPFMAPHCPFAVEEPWFSMADRDLVPDPVPPGRGREPRFKAAIRERYGTASASPALWREVVATYHGMVARLDHQIGRILTALERTGRAEGAVTLFFSDHGEYLGDFGLIEKWPSGMDRCITADPLIVAGGGFAGGRTCQAMVELHDIVPTVLDLAGIEAPHPHFGRSLVPLLEDPGRSHRSHAFTEGGFSEREEAQLERAPFPYDLKAAIQHEEPRAVGRAVAVRDPRWTYVWRLYEPPELYDRQADPAETTNLAGTPAVADVERTMADVLLRWQVDTADVIPADTDPRNPAVALEPGTAVMAEGMADVVATLTRRPGHTSRPGKEPSDG